jgi:hypothetical protein
MGILIDITYDILKLGKSILNVLRAHKRFKCMSIILAQTRFLYFKFVRNGVGFRDV